MLQRRAGRAPQRVRRRSLDWLGAGSPASGRREPPQLAPHCARGAVAEHRSTVPVCCTLQGEELFINGLAEPYRAAGHRNDPASRCPSVDRFIAVSAVLQRRFMAEFLAYSAHDRIVRRAARASTCPGTIAEGDQMKMPANFAVGYFARIASGERPACAG